MSRKVYGIGIAVAIIIGLAVAFAALFWSVNNKAIHLEEQINESHSAINVQEKRRADLIINLVDTVESYNEHEEGTLVGLAEARTQAQEGNVEEARLAVEAVAEAYPELKSVENYKSLMNELSTTENLIAEYRNNYNIQVKAYNKHVRKFPNNKILNMVGYEKLDATYLEYDASEDAPTDLFGDE